MKQKLYIFIASFIALLTLTCCSREDDVNEIFNGKTWYMNGGVINGMKLNSEIKNFYTTAGDAAYKISFTGDAFQCVLSDGVTFNGTWSADGKNHTIVLKIRKKPEMNNPFDNQIYNIISSAKSYDSGADFLFLKQDGGNAVYLGGKRTKIYN